MRDDIKSFLTEIRKPGRYTGGEPGSIYKNPDEIDLRVAFCFPDTYEIGMSNLGMRILCGVLNNTEGVWCERVFAPWTDMEEKMREKKIPLFAHESGDAVKDFGIVAFTLQYELCYTTALNMLDLAGIPLKSSERGEDFPVVIAGGPCAYNPEPMADFVDIFSIGEGEEALPELARLYMKMKKEGAYSKKGFLREASHIKGFYVPSLYNIEYNSNGTISKIEPKYDDVPAKVQKRIVENVDDSYFPTCPVLPVIETVHDRITLEVFRGCIRGCRFCQAGFVTRPVREKSPETLSKQARIIADNSGYDEISMCCLSISDYSKVNTLTDKLLEWTDDEKINLSLPSLRADSFTEELMAKISTVRSSTLTFAPEAGSQRLRDVINKNVTEEDILRAAGVAFSAGKNSVKLYFMNGLPYEKDEDIVEIGVLAKKVIEKYYQTENRNRAKQPKVTLSVACFIPKPFTPFQWEGQNTAEQLERKQKLLMSAITDRKIRYNYHDAKTSFIEAVFARGNRTLSKALVKAVNMGVKFDAWEEFFDYDRWMEIFRECEIDPAFFANRTMDDSEILPWDMIDCGVTKEFLLKERHKAELAATTPSCREKCSGCGANSICDKKYYRWCPGHAEDECAEYLGHGLKDTPKKADLAAITGDTGKRNANGAGAAVNAAQGNVPVKEVKIRFAEKGAFIYVSHLDINRAFMRAVIQSKLPIYYTEGFNPIPKITFASPLSVGAGGDNELARIKLTKDIPNDEIFRALEKGMPEGLTLKETYTSPSKFREIAWGDCDIDFFCSCDDDDVKAVNEMFLQPVIIEKKTKSTVKEEDITQYIKSVYAEKTEYGMRVCAITCADNEHYLNPEYVARAISAKIDPENIGYHQINRKNLLFADGSIFR